MWGKYALVRAAAVAVAFQAFLRSVSLALPVLSATTAVLSSGVAIGALHWLVEKDEALKQEAREQFQRWTRISLWILLGGALVATLATPVRVTCKANGRLKVGSAVIRCERDRSQTVWLWEHWRVPLQAISVGAGGIRSTVLRSIPFSATTVVFPDQLLADPQVVIELDSDAVLDLEDNKASKYAIALEGLKGTQEIPHDGIVLRTRRSSRAATDGPRPIDFDVWVGQLITYEIHYDGKYCRTEQRIVSKDADIWQIATCTAQ